MACVCWAVVFLVASALGTLIDTEAATFRISASYNSNPYLRILSLPDHHQYMLVGTENALLNVSLANMELTNNYTYLPDVDAKSICLETGSVSTCESYVRSIKPLNSTNSLVCGSSAKKPTCRMLAFSNQSQEWQLGNKSDELDQDAFSKAPIYPWYEMAQMVSGEFMYIASFLHPSLGERKPIMIREPLLVGVDKHIESVRRTGWQAVFIRYDAQNGIYPRHVTLFETEEAIYYAFTEPALEIYPTGSRSLPRIARVCKDDPATDYGNSLNFFWSTYFKSRILCGQQAYKPRVDYEPDEGRYGEYLDDLADVTSPFESTTIKTSNGGKIIIMTFNSGSSIGQASAICAYGMSDIKRVFDKSPNLNVSEFEPDFNDANLALRANRKSAYVDGPAKCGPQVVNNTLKEILQPFLQDRVEAINHSPLIILQNPGYKLTKLVVDRGVPDIDGNTHDVMFVGTDDGRVLKMADNGQGFKIVEERLVCEGKSIVDMRIIESENNRHILVNSLYQIKRIGVEKCRRHTYCSSCVASQDVYCSWSVTHNECVRYQHESAKDVNDTRVQNLTSGFSPICWELYPPTTTTTESKPCNGLPELLNLEVGESKLQQGLSQTKVKILIAFIVVCSVICLAAGFFGGYHIALRRKSPTATLDDLTNRNKNTTSKLEDADSIYQLPPQIKSNNVTTPNNLQILNNGKYQMGEYADDTTLQRQKKSYV